MAWLPLIPQATDFISASQSQLLGNFTALDIWSKVDHSTIDGVNNGEHLKITFIPQAPAPVFPVGQSGLYSFLNPLNGNNQIYQQFSNGAQRPLSAGIRIPIVTGNNDGSGYMPNGLLWKSNKVQAALGPNRYDFTTQPNQIPFSAAPAVLLTAFAGIPQPTTIYLTAVDALGFNYTTNATIAAPAFYFFAIGSSNA